MNIVILNMSDAGNKGDLAILESTVGLLRRRFPRCEISLFNIDYSQKEVDQPFRSARLRHLDLLAHYGSFFPRIFTGTGRIKDLFQAGWSLIRTLWAGGAVFLLREYAPLLVKGPVGEKIAVLARADLVVVKGGGYLYSFGGWAQLIYLERHLFPLLLASLLKKKVVAIGHSIGPFRGRLASLSAVGCLRRLDKIAVRDRSSRDLLLSMPEIDPGKLFLIPDLAFWTEADERVDNESDLDSILRREGLPTDDSHCFRVGLTVRRFRRWHFPDCPDPGELFNNYLESIVKTIKYLTDEHDAQVYLMPHALEDLEVGEEVLVRCRSQKPFLLRGDYSTSSLRRIYGRMDCFIATRIHSALFALGEGIPTLAIGYEMNKTYGIVAAAWEKEAVLDVRTITAGDLQQKIDRILKDEAGSRVIITRQVRELRRRIEDSLGQILR